MPRVKTTQPEPSHQKNQRSQDIPNFIPRFPLLGLNRPSWQTANMWRNVVLSQPIALVCKETLVANVLNLDWKIEPRDSKDRDELRESIKYYESFIEDTGDYDYIEITEQIIGDLLDTPFGGGAELGRENDDPNGNVVWVEPLDSATLFPTLNTDYPVGQYVPEAGIKPVYFPWYAINRTKYSPRPELRYKGWSMPPPEKIFMALEMMNKGDIYYANLLLDSPSSGILDLGDMSKESAEEWLISWRAMLTGIDPFKIPVLYEHNNAVNWVAFTRNPSELMYDKAMIKYAALICAGYGMTLSDIGLGVSSNGGETLAGTIRQERQTRRTGFGRVKKKMMYFWNRVLPPTLKFSFIDLDDELNTALGRARLATSTAFQQLIDKRVFTPKEARLQMIADGLITISIPEDIPEKEFDILTNTNQMGATPFGNGGKPNERPNMLGRPVTPSDGGYGEIKSEWNINSDIIDEEISMELEK